MIKQFKEVGIIKTKQLTYGAVFLALAVIIPYFFHTLGINGKVFLPMHIPVLLAGFMLGARYGLFVGALAPLVNFLVSGMPPVPYMYAMIFELAAYGLLCGWLYKRFNLNLLISLVTAMLGGRVVFGLAGWFILRKAPLLLIKGSIMTGLVGIGLQFVLVPVIVKALERITDSSAVNLST